MSGKPSPVTSRQIKAPGLYSRTEDEPDTESVVRTKRTYLLPEDVVRLLKEYQYETWQQTDQTLEFSEIVAEAIREYIQRKRQAA